MKQVKPMSNNRTQAKRDLYCNFKCLNKLPKFSETVVKQDKTEIRLIIMTKHLGFRKEFRSSKSKFKMISAEWLHGQKNYCVNRCTKK